MVAAKDISFAVAGFIGSPAMNFFDCTIDAGVLRLANREIALSTEFQSRFRDNRKVILGIRPEHLTAAKSSGESWVRSEPQIEVVEPMGSEIYLHFNLNGLTGVARLPADTSAEAGKPFALGFDLGRYHFFNAENEKAL